MHAQRGLVAAVAVALVAVAVGVVVAIFGVERLPNAPSLVARPDPTIPGDVAYLRADDERGRCVVVAAASGATQQRLRCDPDLVGLAWTAPGRLVLVSGDPKAQQATEVTLATGEEATVPVPASATSGEHRVAADGTALVVQSRADGRTAVLARRPDGTGRSIVTVAGPDGYRFTSARFSDDECWILATDTAERILIVPTSGGPLRLLAADATAPAWAGSARTGAGCSA